MHQAVEPLIRVPNNLFADRRVQVPPIIILMTKNKPLCDKYDLSSVKAIFTGAAPLGMETANDLQKQYPKWYIRQGYGKPSLLTT